MAVELATAYISIVPSAKNLKPEMEKQFAPAAGIAESAGRESGNRFASGFKSAASKVGSLLGATVKAGLGVASVAATAATAAGSVGIAAAAAAEQSEISFTTMLGSGKKAKAFLADLSKFAAKTPFDMPGLQASASSLVSAGIDASKVIPIMTSLGNATSGMGTGAEGIQRATIALQQMNAAGKISGEDLNQLRDAGIPVFNLLTAATGKTTAEIAEMADKGKLGRTELEQLMKALETGKGLERFNGLMEKQSASLSGMWSTAKDTFSTGMADVVAPAIPLLKQGLGGATDFLAKTALPAMKSGLKEVVGGLVAFGAAWKANDGDVTSSGFAGVMERVAFWLHEAWGGMVAFGAAWKANDGDITSSGFPGFMEQVAFWLHQAWDWLGRLDFSSLNGFFSSLNAQGGTVAPMLASVGDSMKELWPAVKEFGKQAPDLATGGLSLLNQALGFLADHVDDIIAWMPAIVAGFVAWKVGQMALNAAQTAAIPVQLVLNVTRIAAARAEHANAVALRASTTATATNTAANNVSLGTRLRNTAALVGQKIATVATTVATRAAAAGQWLLNAAMTANPIGIVVAAIVALVAGLVWFFTQTELGQQIIQNVWGAIQSFIGATVAWFQTYVLPVILEVFRNVGAVFSWLWTNIIQPVFGFIGALIGAWWTVTKFIFDALVAIVMRVIAPAIMWLWKSVFEPVFGFIGALITWWWKTILKPQFDALVWVFQQVIAPAVKWLYETIIKPAFEGIGKAITWVWENVLKPVFDKLGGVIEKDVPKAFQAGVDFVKKIWEGLQEIVKAPIRFVVNTVLNDGLINAMNGVADFLHIDKLPKIALPQGFAAGGWTGPGPKYAPAGLVHADEHVIRKESRRSMEASLPGLLDHINRYGTLAGYAGGGRVRPLRELVVTNGYNRVHKGIDYAAAVGTPVFAAADGVVSHAGPGARAPGVWGGNEVHILGDGIETWYAHLSRIGVSLGQNIRAGMQIGDSGNTGISSGPHLHFGVFSGGWPNDIDPSAFLGGAAAGGTGWNPIAGLIDLLMDQFKKAFPQGGAFIDLIGGFGKTILTAASDWVGKLLTGRTDEKGRAIGATLYDGGGWLEYTGGPQLVEHNRRRPDAVLTAPQWDTMARIAEGAAHGTEVNFNGPVYGNPQHIVDEMEARKRRAATLHNLTSITVGG